MVGSYWPNSDPWGCSGARVMTIFGSHVGTHIPNIYYFEVYEGIWGYLQVSEGILTYIKVYEGI